MTTLDNGVVVDERFQAINYTPHDQVKNVFGMTPGKDGATIHHWGDDGQTHDAVVNELKRKNERNVSAEFVVSDGRVTCIVSSEDVSWHCGSGTGNVRTIGIECRPEMSQGDLDTLASLLRYLETIHGPLTIYKHSDWVGTACPGRYAAKIDSIVSAVNGGFNEHVLWCKCNCH